LALLFPKTSYVSPDDFIEQLFDNVFEKNPEDEFF
jgi:hypothetical protein